MNRADVVRADLERVRDMTPERFAAEWDEWARASGQNVHDLRRHWIADLEYALPFAEREDAAVAELNPIKDEYRRLSHLRAALAHLEMADVDVELLDQLRPQVEDVEPLRGQLSDARDAVRAIRTEERAGRSGPAVRGDAYRVV